MVGLRTGRASSRPDRADPSGDDATDEDAFATLDDRGLGIVVDDGDRTTHADYRLHELGSLTFDVHYRGHLVHLTFTTTSARVHVDRRGREPITIAIRDDVRVLEPGDTIEVELDVRRDA